MPATSRIVEIAGPARVSYRDRQMRIEREGMPPATVPVEDLGMLVLEHAHTLVSAPLLAALAEVGAAVVVCGPKHLPEGLFLPLAGSALHARTLRGQIAASLPCTKRLWQAVVQAKIGEQARLLADTTGSDGGLRAMVRRVGSGDPANLEGQAARRYFPALFGAGFLRDPDEPGANALLNYGYTVLRAAAARAVVGAGLHPALGVHHRSQYDAFALADDLMEPLRPLVDQQVWRMLQEAPEPDALSPPLKHRLLEVLTWDVEWDGRRVPLMAALGYYAANLRDCLLGEERGLRCPAR